MARRAGGGGARLEAPLGATVEFVADVAGSAERGAVRLFDRRLETTLVERFDGAVPHDLDDLVTVPGVGRKTGNVVRAVAFSLPGLPVDTHVTRLSQRLGLTRETDAVKIEHELNSMIPPDDRGDFSLRLIEHGRRVCNARKPNCGACTLAEICPSAGRAGPKR